MHSVDFSASANFLPGKDGLIHIAQIINKRTNNLSDYLQEGQVIKAKRRNTGQRERIKLQTKTRLAQK